MKKLILSLLVIFSAAVAYAYSAQIGVFANHSHDITEPTSHSGGLDANGGHYDHKNGTYHYHR